MACVSSFSISTVNLICVVQSYKKMFTQQAVVSNIANISSTSVSHTQGKQPVSPFSKPLIKKLARKGYREGILHFVCKISRRIENSSDSYTFRPAKLIPQRCQGCFLVKDLLYKALHKLQERSEKEKIHRKISVFHRKM